MSAPALEPLFPAADIVIAPQPSVVGPIASPPPPSPPRSTRLRLASWLEILSGLTSVILSCILRFTSDSTTGVGRWSTCDYKCLTMNETTRECMNQNGFDWSFSMSIGLERFQWSRYYYDSAGNCDRMSIHHYVGSILDRFTHQPDVVCHQGKLTSALILASEIITIVAVILTTIPVMRGMTWKLMAPSFILYLTSALLLILAGSLYQQKMTNALLNETTPYADVRCHIESGPMAIVFIDAIMNILAAISLYLIRWIVMRDHPAAIPAVNDVPRRRRPDSNETFITFIERIVTCALVRLRLMPDFLATLRPVKYQILSYLLGFSGLFLSLLLINKQSDGNTPSSGLGIWSRCDFICMSLDECSITWDLRNFHIQIGNWSPDNYKFINCGGSNNLPPQFLTNSGSQAICQQGELTARLLGSALIFVLFGFLISTILGGMICFNRISHQRGFTWKWMTPSILCYLTSGILLIVAAAGYQQTMTDVFANSNRKDIECHVQPGPMGMIFSAAIINIFAAVFFSPCRCCLPRDRRIMRESVSAIALAPVPFMIPPPLPMIPVDAVAVNAPVVVEVDDHPVPHPNAVAFTTMSSDLDSSSDSSSNLGPGPAFHPL